MERITQNSLISDEAPEFILAGLMFLMKFAVSHIGGYTDGYENREKVIDLIKSYVSYPNVLKDEILKEHNLGTSKYQSLIDAGSTQICDGNEIKMPEYKGVGDELMKQYKKEIEKGLSEIGSSIPVKICRI